MKKLIAAFSLVLFSFFHSPLSALPQSGGHRALEAEEAADIIDLESQAPNSVEMTEMPTAIIVVDNAWIEANKDLFSRATHLNIDDVCAIATEKFRNLKPKNGCLVVAQVKAGEDPQYFWYSSESIKKWISESSIDPQSRLPVKLVKYFNLNSLEVGKELSLVEDEVMPRSSQALISPEEVIHRLSLIQQSAQLIEESLAGTDIEGRMTRRDFYNCIVRIFGIIGATIWGTILVLVGAGCVFSLLFCFGCIFSIAFQAPDKMYRFCVSQIEPFV